MAVTINGSSGITANDGSVFTNAQGNVGIGTSSPTAKLDVVGNIAASGTVTLSGGTANGVAYLNSSKVLTTGSALTFDGSTFATTGNMSVPIAKAYYCYTSDYGIGTPDSLGLQLFYASGDVMRFGSRSAGTFSEQMRLTSTGLGIGTTSPLAKLVISNGGVQGIEFGYSAGLTANYLESINRSNGQDVDMAYYLSSGSGSHRFYTSGVERMRLNSSGNFGIGTSSPQAKLDVRGFTLLGNYGGTFQGVTLRNNDDSAVSTTISFIDAQNNLQIPDTNLFFGHQTDGGSFIAFATTPPGSRSSDRRLERVRIDSGGNLMIGSTGSFGSTGNQGIRAGSAGQLILGADNGGLYHQVPGNIYYLVTTSGGNTSDAVLKKNVQQLSGSLEKICAMRGVNFEFIEEQMSTPDNGVQVGVIAQEVEVHYPEIVVTNEDGIKSVRYEKLVAPLIEAIKEQQAIIQSLQARLDAAGL